MVRAHAGRRSGPLDATRKAAHRSETRRRQDLHRAGAGDGVNAAPATPYQGLDHFGLSVTGLDDIAADLKRKGVEFTTAPTTPRPGIRVCFLRGPQGISIELLERDPKYV